METFLLVLAGFWVILGLVIWNLTAAHREKE